jgi:anaerobic ribonucleoside-triphosphate reductase
MENKIDIIDKEIAALKQALGECRGRECQVFSRVVGYYQPVQNWNDGKRQEFSERLTFAVPT